MRRHDPILAKLRARIPLADLVGETVDLRPAGTKLRGRCTAHRDEGGGLYVDEAEGYYLCYSCGRSGDVVRWTRETYLCSEQAAIELLCRRVGWTPPAA